MTNITSTDLLIFLELKEIFDFSEHNSFLHRLCNTIMDITNNSGKISYNKTTSEFHCLNIIAYESSDGECINTILFYDFNQDNCTPKTADIKEDLRKIKSYMQVNYQNYTSLNACIIKHISQAQKNSTGTQKCMESYKKNSSGIIALLNLCISMSSVKDNMVKL